MTESTLEALRDALGQVISEQRKQWGRERELIEATARAAVAELRAEVIKLQTELRQSVADRLNLVRDGTQGPPGERGLQGDPGAAGEPGEKGDQGPPGEPGRTGEPGERGEPGIPGEQGLPGEPGPKGDPGEPGQPGEVGPKGDPGESGQPGPKGEPGDSGSPGEVGPKGEPGPRGPEGRQGPTGERGEKGDRGERGEAGLSIKGERGEPGLRGERGERGAIGEPGRAGAPGEKGATGEPGARGERGPMGLLPAVKEWTAGVHYAGNVVMTDRGTYQAARDTAEMPGMGKDWVCLARRGVDGRSPAPRGLFSEAEHYNALDIVQLNGGSFVAKMDDPGLCPGPGWLLLASQGKRGDKGERGQKGEAGQRGEPGLPAPMIAKWHLDRASYVAVPVMSDGREGPPLELRALFEQFQIETR